MSTDKFWQALELGTERLIVQVHLEERLKSAWRANGNHDLGKQNVYEFLAGFLPGEITRLRNTVGAGDQATLWTLYLQGSVYIRLSEYGKAEHTFKELVKICEDLGDVYFLWGALNDLAFVLLEQKKYEETELVCNKLLPWLDTAKGPSAQFLGGTRKMIEALTGQQKFDELDKYIAMGWKAVHIMEDCAKSERVALQDLLDKVKDGDPRPE